MVLKLLYSKYGEAAHTVFKPGLLGRTVLLCILWDSKEIISYELLLSDQTLNSDLYCHLIDCLKIAIDRK